MSEVKDPRSTYRKQARRVLFELHQNGTRPFKCENCGAVPEGVSEDGRAIEDPEKLTRSNNLDANHINKDISDCDPANLEWLCRTCHREKDRSTEKGESPVGDTLYEEGFFV